MLLGVTGDQVLPKDIYEKIKAETIAAVRGTVQADILKEISEKCRVNLEDVRAAALGVGVGVPVTTDGHGHSLQGSGSGSASASG